MTRPVTLFFTCYSKLMNTHKQTHPDPPSVYKGVQVNNEMGIGRIEMPFSGCAKTIVDKVYDWHPNRLISPRHRIHHYGLLLSCG